MHSTSTAKINKTSNLAQGTVRWQAPEHFFDISVTENDFQTDQHNTKASDIYAFAMVGYEVE
jgi:serine/threonine protein kinase